MTQSFFLEAEPWKDAPFKVYLVVVTSRGIPDAIKVMREFFKNDGLEPEVKEVAVIKGTIDEDADTGTTKN